MQPLFSNLIDVREGKYLNVFASHGIHRGKYSVSGDVYQLCVLGPRCA